MEYCGKFGSGLANLCEFGCGESIGESMHMGDPVVQHYGNHLDLVGGDGVPSFFSRGDLAPARRYGLSQPFQQSFKVRHAFAEFTKLLLHRIKPGLQPIDPLIQPRLQSRHVLPYVLPQPAIAGQDQPGQGRPYCQDRKATRANAPEKEPAFFYLLLTSSMIQ